MPDNRKYSNDFAEIPLDGKAYTFDILNLSSKLPAVPAVYMVSSVELIRRLPPVPYPFDIIALGITDNLRNEVASHPAWNQWLASGADLVLFYPDNNCASLENLYQALLSVYKEYNF